MPAAVKTELGVRTDRRRQAELREEHSTHTHRESIQGLFSDVGISVRDKRGARSGIFLPHPGFSDRLFRKLNHSHKSFFFYSLQKCMFSVLADGMRVFSLTNRPAAVWHISSLYPSWINSPVFFLTGGKLASLKLFLAVTYFGCYGNGTAPTGERVRALQKKFALDGADPLADHVCWRHLEDRTLQNLLSRDAAEQRPDSSLSHLSVSEKVRTFTSIHFFTQIYSISKCSPYYVRIITYLHNLFLNLLDTLVNTWRCRATPISIHPPGPIVFLTVGFLFPVLAAHIAVLTPISAQSPSPPPVCTSSVWGVLSSWSLQQEIQQLPTSAYSQLSGCPSKICICMVHWKHRYQSTQNQLLCCGPPPPSREGRKHLE